MAADEAPSAAGRPFTPATLAARWGCSDTLIYDLLNSGKLRSFRIGKLWRIRPEWVEEYEQCQTNTHTPSDASPAPEQTAAPIGTGASNGGTPKANANATRLARMIG